MFRTRFYRTRLLIEFSQALFDRAPRSQCGGQEFDPPLLHQKSFRLPQINKTNFDRYLDEQMRDWEFAERFRQTGEAWEVSLQLAVRSTASEPARSRAERKYRPVRTE